MKKDGNKFTDSQIQSAYVRQLDMVKEWLSGNPNAWVKYVQHRDVIREPAQVAEQVNHFLEGRLDAGAMARVVDPSLYRQRVGEAS